MNSIRWNPAEGAWQADGSSAAARQLETLSSWGRTLRDLPIPRFAPGDVVEEKPNQNPAYQLRVTEITWSSGNVFGGAPAGLRRGIWYIGQWGFAHGGMMTEQSIADSGGGLVPTDRINPRHRQHATAVLSSASPPRRDGGANG